MALAVPFFLALLVSAALVPVCRIAALRLGYVAKAGDGRPQPRAKARFGGVAIVLTLFGCGAAISAFDAVSVLLACSALLFVIGVASDLFALRPSTKLVGVITVASVFLFFDRRLYWSESLTVDSMLTLFWIVGISTAFNLLDNMDGLCGGIALIAGTAFLFTVMPVPSNSPLLIQTQYLVVLLGAIAGFLIFNVHPAWVTMGDAGSLVIGLNMAAMTLQIAPGRGSDLLSIVAVPALLLLIPIVDATLVALSRLTLGSSRASTGREYSSHRLVAMGLSERSAVGLLWVLAGMSGIVAVVADRNQQVSGLLAAMFTIGMALFAVYLGRIRVHESVDADGLPATVTPIEIDLGYRRRLAEVLLDLLLVSVAYYGANRLFFDVAEWAEHFPYYLKTFPLVLGTQMIALFVVGTYRGMWRYFSLSDGVTLAEGVLVGALASQGVVLYLSEGPRENLMAVFVVYGMLLLLLLVGSRASFRLMSEFVQRRRQGGPRLVIYGAGDAGATVVRHLLNDGRSPYRIIGFVDDDLKKRNARVLGYPVIGGYDRLAGMIMAGEVDAVSVAHGGETAGLAAMCARHGVTLHRLEIDWRQIPAAGAGLGAPVVPVTADARLVPFMSGAAKRTGRTVQALQPVGAGASGWRPASESPAPPSRDVESHRIRVVHIITRLILGGAQENTLYTVIGQHRDPRFDVTLLCGVDEAGEGNMFAEASRAGIRTVVLPSLIREIRPLTDIKAFFDVYRFLKRGSYTVVHTHSSKAGIIGRLAARAAGVPAIVHTIHGMAFHEFQAAWKNRLYIALERLCAPISDRIISVSERLSEAAMEQGIGRPEQHVRIFSGIELDLFLSVRERLSVEDAKRRAGIPPGALVVGKIARLFPLKGHEQFLEVAVEVARQMPDVWLLLVGDGPLRPQIQALADELGLGDRLVMVGRVPPDMVPAYIQAMDVVIHTSLREGIARVLPQAGAVGKPVVTFHLDGAPEVIRDGESGYLVPALDTRRVADRTVELLRDPERCRAFGEAGRAFAREHFSVERMVERISAVYVELLDRSRRAAPRALSRLLPRG